MRWFPCIAPLQEGKRERERVCFSFLRSLVVVLHFFFFHFRASSLHISIGAFQSVIFVETGGIRSSRSRRRSSRPNQGLAHYACHSMCRQLDTQNFKITLLHRQHTSANGTGQTGVSLVACVAPPHRMMMPCCRWLVLRQGPCGSFTSMSFSAMS